METAIHAAAIHVSGVVIIDKPEQRPWALINVPKQLNRVARIDFVFRRKEAKGTRGTCIGAKTILPLTERVFRAVDQRVRGVGLHDLHVSV